MNNWPKWDDYLTDVDARVKEGLSGVSLVSEAGLPAKTTLLALRLHVVMREKLPTDARTRFLYRHRLSLVAGIVGVARDLYEQGGLWPYIDHALMARGHAKGLDESTRNDYRRAFVEALREFGLPTVGDGYELVDTAAMHAGIPTYCLDDWFNLTDRARRHVGDDPSEMTVWARANSSRAVMGDIDKPIKRMLTFGPEFAADLFERAAELMDHLGGSYSVRELQEIGRTHIDEFSESGHPLLDQARSIGLEPRWAVRAAANLSTARRSGPRATPGKTPATSRPSVRLDFFSGELELTLPSVPDVQEPVHWDVLIGDRRRSVVASLDWSGAFISSEEVALPITNPIQVVTVSSAGRPLEIPLWATGAPAAFFTQSGTHRPVPAGVITPGSYWALVPSGASFTAAGESLVIARDDAPLGWSGWDLAQVDLKPGQSVEVQHPEASFLLRVRGGESPQLRFPPDVAGARAFGMALLAERPAVRIPESSGTWRISVTRRGSDEPSWVRTVEEPGDYALLDGDVGHAGTFEVSVRGPLGHGMKETFALVDGLAIEATPGHRALDPQGRLAPVTAAGRAAAGISLTPSAWSLPPEQSSRVIKVVADSGERYSFVHRPSATWIGSADAHGVIRWAPRPARVDSSTLSQSPELLVRTPSAALPVVSVVAGGRVIQLLSPKRQLTAWSYRLGELAGSFEEHGALRLFLPDGQPVASVSPRPTFRGATLSEDADAIELTEWSGQASEMEAWVWLEQALWRQPLLLGVHPGGRVLLPETLRHSGPLLLHVRACDPWVPQDDPRLPVPILRIDAPGEVEYTAAEDAVVRTAAGDQQGQLTPASAPVLVDLWLGGHATLRNLPYGASARLRIACERIAEDVIVEAGRRDLDRRETARVLVASGAIQRLIDPPIDRAQSLWDDAPWIAAALGTGWLLGADEVASEGMRSAAVREFGSSLIEILEDGRDPHGGVGRFDASTDIFESMPSDQARELLAALGIVPKAMLDKDSRADRIRRISQARSQPEFSWIPDCKHPLMASEAALEAMGQDLALSDIRALHPHSGRSKHHWLPPFARAAAMTARLAARGLPGAIQASAGNLEALAQLAEADPDLVLAELARADALIAALDQAGTLPSLESSLVGAGQGFMEGPQ